jgi:ethanolamine utilization protein EutN
MQIGRVVGHAVATVKHPSLTGWRLLVVQLLTADGTEDGEPLLAVDKLGAGVNNLVVLSNDGAGAREMIGVKNSPVRWMVLGMCDSGSGSHANR